MVSCGFNFVFNPNTNVVAKKNGVDSRYKGQNAPHCVSTKSQIVRNGSKFFPAVARSFTPQALYGISHCRFHRLVADG